MVLVARTSRSVRARIATRGAAAVLGAGLALGFAPSLAGAATAKSWGGSRASRQTAIVTQTTSTPTSTPAFTDGFGSIALGTSLAPGTATGAWMPVWNGFGTITRVTDVSPSLELQPATATAPTQTHSSLVTSVPAFGDSTLSMSLRTVAQLRQGSAPNPWETGWALWHYSDNAHFYYVLLKPNGWELGKEDPAYPGNQRFLTTGSTPFAVGSWHMIQITQVANTINVTADGLPLTTFVDSERPYLTGSIGLYCEDSQVHFSGISATGQL